jgi:hypothetical protein
MTLFSVIIFHDSSFLISCLADQSELEHVHDTLLPHLNTTLANGILKAKNKILKGKK